jgi:hypothetical protein
VHASWCVKSACAWLPKAMTLSRSAGRSRSRIEASARFAWAIESPAIEPEQSTTIFTLRGSTWARPPNFGWKDAITTCPAGSQSAVA